MSHEERIKKALAKLESSSSPNYSEIAQKYQLVQSTLSRHAKGQTTSRQEYQLKVN